MQKTLTLAIIFEQWDTGFIFHMRTEKVNLRSPFKSCKLVTKVNDLVAFIMTIIFKNSFLNLNPDVVL